VTGAHLPILETRYDLIGVDAVYRGLLVPSNPEPSEVRARVAVRTGDLASARQVAREVASLWLNGPAGGGGVTRSATEDVAIVSVFLPRREVSVNTAVLGTREGALA
jgi:hypothetical protein